ASPAGQADGARLRFFGADRGRRHRPRRNSRRAAPEAGAEGVRDPDSDDAGAILADLPKDEQTEILEQLPPPERVALARSLLYPENSAGRGMKTEVRAVARVGR